MPELERLADGGDACAAGALAEVLTRDLAFPEAWRRALRYAIVAQDAGATVDCRLFEMAQDYARMAKCFKGEEVACWYLATLEAPR